VVPFTYSRWVHSIVTRSVAMCFLFQVSSGHEEVVRELVGAQADVNRKNDKGITPLFVFRGSPFPTSYNDFGTHRHYAASKSRIEVSIRPSPLSIVLYSISIKIGRFLISRGADVSAMG
jgi:hypothetical protein